MVATPETGTRVEIALYDVQDDFVHDDHKYVVFLGGRFAGKSHAGAVKAALKCTQPGLGLVAAPNFPMLEHAAKRTFLDRLDALGLPYEQHKSLGSLTIPRTGAEVVFATLETESRIRGPGFAWAWVDELEYVSRQSTWTALKGAVREGPNPQLFATTTPRGRRLVWSEWVQHPDPQHALYRAGTLGNPFVDAATFVRDLGYTGQTYAQEIDAQFVAFEGLVYPGFHREQHIQTVDCTGWATALGLDTGTRNPTACLTVRSSGERVHLERELYRTGMSASEIVAATVREYERSGASLVVVDPSSTGLILDLQRAGLQVRKANNDIITGIQRVSAVLPHFTVDASCINFIAEMESYHYPERHAERDVPVKEFDHCMDSFRYVCLAVMGPRKRVRFV
ncbi:MAG TPA: terminase family protein [Tepidisphaeraceae bacterium]|jgi:hypothetical protein